jgi:hypothetical protein
MKAEIKRYHSPDISDLDNFKPENENEFGFLLQVIVGIKSIDSEESFDLIVCTPRWLEKKLLPTGLIFGEHYLIIVKYDFDKIKNKIVEYINKLDEDNWELLATKIDRIGKWEFRDYQK